MTAYHTLRSQVLSLSAGQRLRLMADIEQSLPPPPCCDEDDGVAEAMRRLEEGEKDPSAWLTEEQFDAALRAARKQ